MKSQLIIFFAILFGLFVYTTFKAQQLLPAHPLLSWIFSLAFFSLMMVPQFLTRSNAGAIHSSTFRIFSLMGSIAMGAWATFVLIWLVVDCGHGFLILLRLIMPRFAPTGSVFYAGWISCAIFMLSVGIAGFGLMQARGGPQIKEVPIQFPNLPNALEGLKIVLISDLHIGPSIRRKNVQAIVDQVLALKPDLIAVTGDLVDGSVEALKKEIEPLAQLKAPLGTYYVTGNHEYYWGAEEWIEKIKSLGFVTLINENQSIPAGSAKILISGIPDLSAEIFDAAHKPNLEKALFSYEKTDLKILLSHRPNVASQADTLGFDLLLSGHTHGGQFFPFTLLVPLFQKYHRGLYRLKRLAIYVSVGTGYWGPPNRFWNPSEIAVLRIHSS